MIKRRLTKIILWTLAGIVLLAAAGAVAIQTRLFKDWLRDRIVRQANNSFAAQLEIERLEGDIIGGVELYEVRLIQDHDTILALPRISMDYSLLSSLSGDIAISELEIDSPVVFLRQLSDSTWNFDHLLNKSAVTDDGGLGQSGQNGLSVNIHNLTIRNGLVRIESSTPYIPRKIDDINLTLAAAYHSGSFSAHLSEGTLISIQKRFPEVDLSFKAEMDSDVIRLDDMVIRTRQNRLAADISLKYRGTPEASLNIKGDSIALGELNRLLPWHPAETYRPDLTISARLYHDSLTGDIMLVEGDQEVKFNVRTTSPFGFVFDSVPAPSFTVSARFSDIQPALWIEDTIPDMRLTGDLNIEGNGRPPYQAEAKWLVNLHDSRISRWPLNEARISGDLAGRQLSFAALLESAFARADLTGGLSATSIPEYHLEGDITDLDLEALLHDLPTAPHSDLSLHIQAQGRGFDPDRVEGYLRVRTDSSVIAGLVLDSAYAELTAAGGNLSLDTIMLSSPVLNLSASGDLTGFDSLGLSFDAVITDMGHLRELFAQTNIEAGGRIKGEIHGTTDSSIIRIDFDLDSIDVAGLRAASVRGNLAATATPFALSSAVVSAYIINSEFASATADSVTVTARTIADTRAGGPRTAMLPEIANFDIEYDVVNITHGDRRIGHAWGTGEGLFSRKTIEAAEASLNISSADIYDFRIDSLAADAQYSTGVINLAVRAETADELSAAVLTDIYPDSIITLVVPLVDINFRSNHIRGGGDSSTIVIDGDRYHFANFVLSGTPDSKIPNFQISLNGTVGGDSDEGLSVNLADLRLQDLPLPEHFIDSLGGTLSMNLSLHNSFDSLSFTGQFAVVDGFVQRHDFDELSGRVIYVPDSLDFQVALRAGGQNRLNASGYLPVALSRLDSGLLIADKRMMIHLTVDDVPLDMAAAVTDILENAAGMVACELTIQNTPDDPTASGTISITQGEIMLPSLGISIDNLQTAITIDSNRIVIDECRGRSGDGKIDLTGYVMLSDILTAVPVPGGELSLKVTDFTPINRMELQMAVNADMRLNTKTGSPEAEGTVEILEADLWLPAFTSTTQLGQGPDEQTLPLLVQAAGNADSAFPWPADSVSALALTGLMERLHGRIYLKMNRNFWVKGKDLRAEISGNLEVVKDSLDFRLFGTVEILRGHVMMLSRRFNISEGLVTFTGNPKPDPILAITAEYKFRGSEHQNRILTLKISGTLEEPELSFLLDDATIDESDAFSFLIFGVAPDDMASANQGIVSDAITMDLASSFASQGLSKLIGEQFGLDYIEIYATDSWKKTSFVAGKYLTDRWFLSYEREFNKEQSQETTPVKVTAEYSLSNNILFRLISGSLKERGTELLIRLEHR